jgi:hypothetical protein
LLIPFFILSFFIGWVNLNGSKLATNQNSSVEFKAANSAFNSVDVNIGGIFKQKNTIIKNTPDKQYFDFIFKTNKLRNEFHYKPAEIFGQAPWHYFTKAILPLNLQYIYPNISYFFVFNIAAIFIIFILPLALYDNFHDKLLLLIPALSMVFLLPYLGVTDISFFYWSNVSDRYLYCFILVLVFALGLIGKNYKNKKFKYIIFSYCIFLTIQNDAKKFFKYSYINTRLNGGCFFFC